MLERQDRFCHELAFDEDFALASDLIDLLDLERLDLRVLRVKVLRERLVADLGVVDAVKGRNPVFFLELAQLCQVDLT